MLSWSGSQATGDLLGVSPNGKLQIKFCPEYVSVRLEVPGRWEPVEHSIPYEEIGHDEKPFVQTHEFLRIRAYLRPIAHPDFDGPVSSIVLELGFDKGLCGAEKASLRRHAIRVYVILANPNTYPNVDIPPNTIVGGDKPGTGVSWDVQLVRSVSKQAAIKRAVTLSEDPRVTSESMNRHLLNHANRANIFLMILLGLAIAIVLYLMRLFASLS